jgi:hypothetical protein
MNRIGLVFLVAAILPTAPSLTAQQQVFDAKVPFQFSAGDRTLPAGEYRIVRHNDFLNIENRTDYSSALILAFNGDSSKDGQVHLVFDDVNDLLFLRKVVAPAGSIELAVSSTEKKAKRDQHRLSTANPPLVLTPGVTAAGQ